MKPKIITSAFVTKHKSGITSVMINLLEKQCACYHSHSEYDGKATTEVFVAGLRRRKKEKYVVDATGYEQGKWLHSRCKDQAIFYHIPFRLVCEAWEKKGKTK
jgi:hypothetical protein